MNIVFDNNVSLVIDDSWQSLKTMPKDPPGTHVFGKATENCKCFIIAHPISVQHTMPFGDPQKIINGVHAALADEQALIEVKSGSTEMGKIVYSIIKTKKQPSGVQYTLTMDMATKSGAVHIQGFFDEAGVTGRRDVIIYELERRNGNVTKDFEGWMIDPYDSSFRRGMYLMNLSELEKYDSMFPQHPLSVARAFIRSQGILL